ncbi:MAG: aminoacyl-tRNA deacylase [Deltaproteobacteria bacterium]|nr:aminoacyl-tRNA deacylase [Deltaproteobacteria bacterium]
MAAKEKVTGTPAIRMLKKEKVDFVPHFYRYEDRGGTKVASRELNIGEHLAVKTIVMEDENGDPFIVLMNGDKEVSAKTMARLRGAKTVRPCTPEEVQRHTGYQVGGTSPFGTRKPLPLYMERSILELERIYINGGRRGLLVEMPPAEVVRILDPVIVEAGY